MNRNSPLFTVDDDLHRAVVEQNTATLINARQNFERAAALLQKSAGTQATYDLALAALREAEARLNSSKVRLERRRVFSPAVGRIQQIYFRPGEVVPAGRAVLALLPNENVKARFYVPEGRISTIAPGATVSISCDNCDERLTARVIFVSPSAEYTPEVIYSREQNSKLGFRIEARPAHPERLRVGQPISVNVRSEASSEKGLARAGESGEQAQRGMQ